MARRLLKVETGAGSAAIFDGPEGAAGVAGSEVATTFTL